MHRRWKWLTPLVVLSMWPGAALAKPVATQVFCEQYPQAPVCDGGVVECVTCHTTPPARNLYGEQVEKNLLLAEPRPLTDMRFAQGLADALKAIEALDADNDGASNLDELTLGTSPSDATSVPTLDRCTEDLKGDPYDVCAYDPAYVYRKLHIDFCGFTPNRQEQAQFSAAPDQTKALDDALTVCLQSEFWRGRDGVLWNMANSKILPTAAIKSGEEEPGPIPLADYLDDYNFYVYTQIDDHDSRDLLIGDYFVSRQLDQGKSVYEPFQRTPQQDYAARGQDGAQAVTRPKRAGMLTHRWFLMRNTMFTGLPRTTAAQAYRAYLGLDISRMEGLSPIPNEPVDYDAKGVKAPECAVCHSTLDPLTYPFSRYEGIQGGTGGFRLPFTYNATRLRAFTEVDGPEIVNTPEEGYIFGQKVEDLRDWADVAANSEAFARARVMDYWALIFGESPRASEQADFNALWRALAERHNYVIESMLHDLIKTEAYGVP